MENRIIRRSENYQQFQVAVVTAVAVLLVVLSFLVLRGTREILGLDMSLFGWLVRAGIILFAIGVVVVAKKQFKNKQYSFSGNKLTVSNRSFGASKSQQIITIEPKSVLSVKLNQNFLDKKLDSGTIEIEADSMSGRDVYKLENIDNPQQVLKKIEAYLK